MNKGFTLIEVIIYLALFSIIIGGGMVAAYQVIQSTDASYNHVLLQEEANFLIRKINLSLTGATNICLPASGNSTILKINCSSLIFEADSSNLKLDNVILNSSRIVISNLLFQRISVAGKPDSITTSFTLTTNQGGRLATQDFSFIKYLRQ